MLNKGIAFGLWSDIPIWVVTIALLALIVCAVKTREMWGRIGILFILLGGSANLVMRYIYGGVVDGWQIGGILYNNFWDYLIVIGLGIFTIQYWVWKSK